MVSIIIPNYNHAPYLVQRINSVLNQTFRDFEVIILDDCSTDNSRDVIEKYRGHEKISHIEYNEQNSGSTFKQWQKGLSLAKGEWIWIAESDDWCELNFLESLIVENNKEIDLNTTMIFCNTLRFVNNNLLYFSGLKHMLLKQEGNDFIQKNMIKNNTLLNASMLIFRKSKYESVNRDWVDYKFCGDWLLWVYLMIDSNAIEVGGKVLNYFRSHDANVSSNALKNGTDQMEKVKLWFRMLNLNLISEYSFFKLLYFMWYDLTFNMNINKSTKSEIKMIVINYMGQLQFYKFRLIKLLGRLGR